MALDGAAGVNVISAYDPGRVRIREQVYTRSLIILPDRLLTDWEPTTVEQLRAAHFQPLFDERPEVVILGTGETQVFPEPAVFMALMDMGIGYEIMDSGAACRTYNILVAENRRAALALMLTMA